jgi:hypothetical protein
VGGGKIDQDPARTFGPVMGVTYTLSRGSLKMTVQLPPLGTDNLPAVVMELWDEREVVWEETGEILYTLRIQGVSFTPKVFEPGLYTVGVGEPDSKYWKQLKGLKAGPAGALNGIRVEFN